MLTLSFASAMQTRFPHPKAVAVDDAGDVYVGSNGWAGGLEKFHRTSGQPLAFAGAWSTEAGRAGRIFYFRPGHETCPTWHHPQVQQVMINAVRWAAPTGTMAFEAGPRLRDDLRPAPDLDRPRALGGSHPLRDVLDPARGDHVSEGEEQ